MDVTVGLCAACAHARTVVSGRGSTFWLCGLSETDRVYPKYPRLPVLRCVGFTRTTGGEAEPSAAPPDADR